MYVALVEAHAFLENAAANFIGELAAAVLILVISGLMYRGSSPSKKSKVFHVDRFIERVVTRLQKNGVLT
jgi:hypothetical protein